MPLVRSEWQNPYDGSVDADQLWGLFESRMLDFGFDSILTYTYTLAPVSSTAQSESGLDRAVGWTANKLSYLVGGQVDLDRLADIAFENNLISKDPFAHQAQRFGTVAALGLDFLSPEDENYADAHQFFEREYATLGGRNALLIPVQGLVPSLPHGFGLHMTKTGDVLLGILDRSIDAIILDCMRFAAAFDISYRRKLAADIGITEQQYTVLRSVCAGHSNKAIADMRGLKEPTISFHLKSLLDRLNIASSRELPLAAFRLGLMDIG